MMKLQKLLLAASLVVGLSIMTACNLLNRASDNGGDESAISIADLHAHPKQYQHLDGRIVTVIGYVDFNNIHDLREMYYPEEALGFVAKPGQMAEAVFFAHFASSVDPHPLFDQLHKLQPAYETDGLRLLLTGTLHVYEQPTNFATNLGYTIDIADIDNITVLSDK